jgi:hypothetical protein
MPKTEVYSWRLAPEKKRALERRARAQGQSVAQLLDRLTEDLLANHPPEEDEAEQRRLHAAAAKFVGAVSLGNPRGSETVEQELHKQLKRRYGR